MQNLSRRAGKQQTAAFLAKAEDQEVDSAKIPQSHLPPSIGSVKTLET